MEIGQDKGGIVRCSPNETDENWVTPLLWFLRRRERSINESCVTFRERNDRAESRTGSILSRCYSSGYYRCGARYQQIATSFDHSWTKLILAESWFSFHAKRSDQRSFAFVSRVLVGTVARKISWITQLIIFIRGYSNGLVRDPAGSKKDSAALLSLQRSRGSHSLMVPGGDTRWIRFVLRFARQRLPHGDRDSNGPAISRIPGARVVSAQPHLQNKNIRQVGVFVERVVEPSLIVPVLRIPLKIVYPRITLEENFIILKIALNCHLVRRGQIIGSRPMKIISKQVSASHVIHPSKRDEGNEQTRRERRKKKKEKKKGKFHRKCSTAPRPHLQRRN